MFNPNSDMSIDYVKVIKEKGLMEFFTEDSWGTVMVKPDPDAALLLTEHFPGIRNLPGMVHPERVVHCPGIKLRLHTFDNDVLARELKQTDPGAPSLSSKFPSVNDEDLESQGMLTEDEWTGYLVARVPLIPDLIQGPATKLADPYSTTVPPPVPMLHQLSYGLASTSVAGPASTSVAGPASTSVAGPAALPSLPPIPAELRPPKSLTAIMPSSVHSAPGDPRLPPVPTIKRRRKQRKVPDSEKDEKYWVRRAKNTIKAKKCRDQKKEEKKAKTLRVAELMAVQEQLRVKHKLLMDAQAKLRSKFGSLPAPRS